MMRGPGRWVRGAVIGSAASLLALGGHVLAGEPTPPAATVLALVAVTVLASVGLSGRRWTTGWLLGVLLGAQVAFHVALASGSGHSGHAALTPAGPSSLMAVAHLGAALLSAALLKHGEDACWHLAQRLSQPWRALTGLPATLLPFGSVRNVLGSSRPVALTPAYVIVDAPRRGPPGLPARW
jgi:hypothetical protein